MRYAGGVRLAKSDRGVLESWLRAPTTSQELALRARIVIASADGEAVRPLATRLGISPTTVCLWRRRYESEGLAGLTTRHRSGRKRRITDGKERAVVAATMKEPKDTTHWST